MKTYQDGNAMTDANTAKMGGFTNGKFYQHTGGGVERIGSGEPSTRTVRVTHATDVPIPSPPPPPRVSESQRRWEGWSRIPLGMAAETTAFAAWYALSPEQRERFDAELDAVLDGKHQELRTVLRASGCLLDGVEMFTVAVDIPTDGVLVRWNTWLRTSKRLYSIAEAVKIYADPKTDPRAEIEARRLEGLEQDKRNREFMKQRELEESKRNEADRERQEFYNAWQRLPLDARNAIRTASITSERAGFVAMADPTPDFDPFKVKVSARET
jgi:hypothetical protein